MNNNEAIRREKNIAKRKEEQMDKVWDTILGAILGASIGFALAGIIASFAYRPVYTIAHSDIAHSVQVEDGVVYYTYIPELEGEDE